MFRMGDEFLQTQGGNNNPYNQDNETSWLEWQRQESQADFWRFCRKMIEFRKMHHSIARSQFWRDDVRWYGVNHAPDLSYPSRSIAFCLHGTASDTPDLYVMINAYWMPLRFGIHEKAPGQWKRVIDTSQPSPDDIVDRSAGLTIQDRFLDVQPRSVVVLVSDRTRS